MILTGRPVDGHEAFAIGLANRIVEEGKSKAEAEKLAEIITKFPQRCLREDRLSTYDQFNYDWERTLANEFNHGLISLKDVKEGIDRFDSGEGRHGQF